MKRKQYSTILKAMTIALMIATPFFVAMDAKRLGYVPMNGAWITWMIPAILLVEVNHAD